MSPAAFALQHTAYVGLFACALCLALHAMFTAGGPAVIVTAHALDRYVERVDPRATRAEAREIIEGAARAVSAAAAFGCRTVRLACGARLVLGGDHVVTVLAPVPRRKRFGWLLQSGDA